MFLRKVGNDRMESRSGQLVVAGTNLPPTQGGSFEFHQLGDRPRVAASA